MVRNSFSLEESDKKWEKTQKGNTNKQTNITPNLKTSDRRNSLPNVDKDGFQYPKNPVKINSGITPQMAPTDTANQYQVLNTVECTINSGKETDTMETDYGINETNEQLKSTQDTTDNASQNTETTNAKTYRPSPIFVQGEKAIDTIQALRTANINQETFSITMSKGQHQLLAKNQLSFEKIKEVLIANNFNFYSFTPKSEKLKSLLLKGMSPDVTTDMVFKDLTEKNIPSVVFKKVSELKFMRDDEPRRHLIVQVTQTSSLKELFKTRQVLNLKARWERLRRNRALQCRKWQRLGHTAANCQMEYRCVRCGDSSHAPAQCPLKDEKTRDKSKCANCGKNGHPASYAGCRFMKFEKISRNQARAQKNKSLERNIEAIYREVTPQISFANAMSSSRDSFPPLKHRNQTNFQAFQGGPPPPPVTENTSPNKLELIQKTKHTINLIKSELRKEFNKSVEDYWKGQLKQINHKDPTSFFPKINRFLRKKNRISIADQRIKINDPVCQSGAIDVIKAIKIEDELLITEPIDKLNGTVNSPLLFNIFTMALLQLFNLNIKENLFAVAYADDIIVGVAGKNPTKLQNELKKLVNNINDYYKIWNLRMNPEKCETAFAVRRFLKSSAEH
ncbi:Similar to ORF1: Nucleic-acid-binding protein from transposon X-element (Drosophila melanogaster) [Cotesia congregata]|uniref:Similar to ORF1: Nucleic-acid-binding protein from transposon X-element (Drosophila melanogaster) n=1 Tax=Cotesia congregata TaxID=51543 RepID=A0A8J2MY07_COTCN|nr:Similar to ORF1: Nucleic-acid-binding protein from transposon X-element (Drosophila melanogaster) [Cotesia congregata]